VAQQKFCKCSPPGSTDSFVQVPRCAWLFTIDDWLQRAKKPKPEVVLSGMEEIPWDEGE
jgi:hypothetical protein